VYLNNLSFFMVRAQQQPNKCNHHLSRTAAAAPTMRDAEMDNGAPTMPKMHNGGFNVVRAQQQYNRHVGRRCGTLLRPYGYALRGHGGGMG
jgi:hypothetical protein